MESYVKILIGIGVLVYYVARSVNKAKAKAEQSNAGPKIPPRKEPLEPFTNAKLDEIFDFEKTESKPAFNPTKTTREQTIKKPSLFTKSQPLQTIDESDETEDDVHPILKDFDAQKAIIYSEILKPPYL